MPSHSTDSLTTAVVLAGGLGTRLWPASRRDRPKHLVPGLSPGPATGRGTLLEATVTRLAPLVGHERVYAVSVADQAAAVAEVGGLPDARVLAEPFGRNTAAAVAFATLRLAALDPDADPVLAFLPADHHVADPDAFRRDLAAAADTARAVPSAIVTLGVVPTRPATGYGYIEYETAAAEVHGPTGGPKTADRGPTPIPTVPHRGVRFVEKPCRKRAAAMAADGRHLWNAGIFVGRRTAFETALATYAPRVWRPLREALSDEAEAPGLAQAYQALPPLPFDVAVMERLPPGSFYVVPSSCGWSDVGSFASLHAAAPGGTGGLVRAGPEADRAVVRDAEHTYLYAEGATVAVLGVSGIAVVASAGRVLVCPLERAEEVRALVEALPDEDR